MASMTVNEVRDRLDQRFRLLVGPRRGLARHQTLRHAVQWSYDHLEDAEKGLLERCSAFAGGFDLQSACAVMGSDDEFFTLDLLDALVRKSLLVADRSSGRTRFSMLETIRQFAEDQLVARGEASEIRGAHSRYFAGREADIMALWDSPRQREAYDWLTVELANLRTAFRWVADHGNLDDAVTIATYAGFLGYLVENYEPIAWAEELIEPACAVDHSRLAFLYVIASLSWMAGRVEAAVGYTDACQTVLATGRAKVPFGLNGLIGVVYLAIGQPERYVQVSRAQLARGHDTHAFARASITFALTAAGSRDEAIAAATRTIEAAETTRNPAVLSLALLAYGYAMREADPVSALAAVRRGLVIAQDSGNRGNETHLAATLARLEAEHGDPLAALKYTTLAIRNYHDSGAPQVHPTLALLAALLDRLGRYESAATIAGFACGPFTTASIPELRTAIAHLRDVLGDKIYELLARKGEAMTTAAMVTYAYDQIDQARTELNSVSE
jgi:tetratricopeptide (TPR) repeat protein